MTFTMKVAGAAALMFAAYALLWDGDRCPSENVKTIQVSGILVAGCRELAR